MTRQEWNGCTDPTLLLEFVRTRGLFDERRVRLFVTAACRRAWHLSGDARSHNAVLVGERYADGAATEGELLAAASAANEASYRGSGGFRDAHLHLAAYTHHTADAFLEPPAHARPAYGGYAPEAFSDPEGFACMACISTAQAVASAAAGRADEENWRALYEATLDVEYLRQASLLRDIFGDQPFRTSRLDPRWRTQLVLSLAHAAYEERIAPDPSRAGWLTLNPARLMVLADALEDAGCQDADILGHCRQEGLVHVRGCWVVDLLTARQ
jgi:hypothetical protein